MKKLLFAAVLVAGATAFAFEFKPNEKMLRATGGFIVKPDTQKGEVVYVNCQTAADKAWIAESVAYCAEITRFKVTLQEGAFDVRKPVLKGNITVFVIDDADLPALLCAPEVPWAAVNVAKLKSEKPAFFAARLKKELSRAFAMVCGGAGSQYKGTLLLPVTKAEDLDRHLDHRLPADVIARISANGKAYGLAGEVRTTYIVACKQGWAPAPTNDYQKVIWEKVKAEADAKPSNPIKITKPQK